MCAITCWLVTFSHFAVHMHSHCWCRDLERVTGGGELRQGKTFRTTQINASVVAYLLGGWGGVGEARTGPATIRRGLQLSKGGQHSCRQKEMWKVWVFVWRLRKLYIYWRITPFASLIVLVGQTRERIWALSQLLVSTNLLIIPFCLIIPISGRHFLN